MKSQHRRFSVLFVVLSLLAAGCSTTGGQVIKVDARKAEGVRSLRQEITWMLEDLGYEWVPVKAAEYAGTVKAYRHAEQWRMLFQAREQTDIKIDARFDVSGYTATLRFYRVGAEGLDAMSEPYFRKLRERLVLEFGADQIGGDSSLLGF